MELAALILYGFVMMLTGGLIGWSLGYKVSSETGDDN